MSWTSPVELRTIEVGHPKKRKLKNSHYVKWTKVSIPAPYDRILGQLVAEVGFAMDHNIYEALRRQSYANEILDGFVDEIDLYSGPSRNFRSKVLSPILQRQLKGVYDAQGPMVRSAVGTTIGEATEFYLEDDPTDPGNIPIYRRNIIYSAEARWHLAIIMGLSPDAHRQHYLKVIANHDKILEAVSLEPQLDVPPGEIPPLRKVEARVIVDEGLCEFFRPELYEVVRITPPIHRLSQLTIVISITC